MSDKTESPAIVQKPAKPETSAKPGKATKTVKAEPARPKQHAKAEKSAKPEKATKSEKTAKPEKAAKPEKPAKAPKAEKTAKAAKPEKPAKPGKPGKAANPAAAPLHEGHCKPRKGAEHRLDGSRIEAFLKQLPDWKLIDAGAAIEKTYTFKNYYRTLAFVNALAFIAHDEDHHPDLGVHYGKVIVRYSTHDVGGLSMNDLICAAKVERLPRAS